MNFFTVLCLLPTIICVEQEGYDPTGGVSDEKKLNVVDTYKAPSCSMETQESDKIFWHYKGTLLNGHVFDEGDFNARLGQHDVIPGVDKGMRGLCVGDKRRMTIHYDWAYGERGVPGTIPPKSHLIFDVELLSIERPGVGKVTKDDIISSDGEKKDNADENGGVSKENKLKIKYIFSVDHEYCSQQTDVNDTITYSFESFFLNGTAFQHGNYTNKIGHDEVITGIDKGLLEMCVGDERELVIHHDWAFGEEGFPDAGIPANMTFIYDVHLLRIVKPDGSISDIEELNEPKATETAKKIVDLGDEKLKIEDIFKADGEKCNLISQEGDKIRWRYNGTLLNGHVFDKGEYATTLGSHGVITGVDKGMREMCVGDKRKITIHSDWAYGDKGVPGTIPPKAALIFNVELLFIKRPDGRRAIVNSTNAYTNPTIDKLTKLWRRKHPAW